MIHGKTLRFESVGASGKLLGSIELPVAPVQVVEKNGYVYAACRTAGLYVVDATDPASPKVSLVKDKGRDVVGIRISGDLLLVSLAKYALGVFRLTDPAHPRALQGGELAGGAPPLKWSNGRGERRPRVRRVRAGRSSGAVVGRKRRAARRAKPRVVVSGKVVKVARGKVYFDRGTDAGLSVGDRVAIIRSKKVQEVNPLTKAKVTVQSRRTMAVVRIEHAERQWSRAVLGRGDSALVGDRFETTVRRLTANKYFPRRLGGLWRIRFGLWPVIGVNTRAFSLMSFSSVAYEFKFPLKISVELAPLIAVLGKPHSGVAGNVLFTAAYSSRFFELGFGVGYQGVAYGRSGGVIGQTIRLGAIDGLNLTFMNQLVWSDDNSDGEQRFMVGSLSGQINIPLVSRVSMFFSGGGGSQRYGYGDAGVRIYVHGTGGPGTIIISSSLGMAYIVSERRVTKPNTNYTETEKTGGYGVTASLGLDFRL